MTSSAAETSTLDDSTSPQVKDNIEDISGLEEKEKGDVESAQVVPSAAGCGAAGPPAIEFPEGGLRGWLCLLGAFLVLFSTFGYANAFGVYQSYYQLHQLSNETASNISWIGSIQLWLQFSMGAVAGPLFDRGHFHFLLGGGSVLYIFSLFMVSLCKTFWQAILAQAIGMGLGMGLLFLPAISVLSHYFQKRRSLAMGVAVSGSSLGGIIFPIMLNRLFVSVGFEQAVRATGYLVLGCLFIANLCMKPRLPGRRTTGTKPPSPLDLFREPKYSIAVAGAFFIAWGIFFPFFYLQVYCEFNGLSQTISFYSLSILNAASVFGRTIPNALADKVGAFNLILPCCSCATVLIFAMLGAKTPGGAIAFAILFGFFSGGYVSLLSPVFISMSKNVAEFGVRVGFAFIVVGLAALSGTPIAGALLARTNNGFYAPIVFSGISTAIGSGLLVLSRFIQARDKRTWKV